MAPFPETEIMTIKRLEVALRKNDFKLLKDGAYKLHEKYHGGFKFEYLDLLKDIFLNITNNASIPSEIKDILAPTIEDILSQQGVNIDTSVSPSESYNQNRVSSLTSLSYNTNPNAEHNENKINAFDAFGASKQQNNQPPQRVFTQSPFSARPFEEFNSNPDSSTPVQPINPAKVEDKPEIKEETVAQQIQNAIEQVDKVEENIDENMNHNVQEQTFEENEVQEQVQNIEQIEEAPVQEVAKKSISIFYGQEFSNDKTRNILKLHNMLKAASEKEFSIGEILKLISEINTQADANVFELKTLVEQLKLRNYKANIITNSQSSNFDELFATSEINYGVFAGLDEKDINLLPLFGLSNLFRCSNCGRIHLEKRNTAKALILECPNCKNPMIADFYAQDRNKTGLNIEYYNNAMLTLAKSNVWVLIRPMLDDVSIFNLLISAIQLGADVQDIYILEKDINIREKFRNIFLDINPELNINFQINALEDFFAKLN